MKFNVLLKPFGCLWISFCLWPHAYSWSAMHGGFMGLIQKVLAKNPVSLLDPSSRPMVCLSTESNSFQVGLAHQMIVDAPFDRVVKVFEGFSDYPDIFDTIRGAKILKQVEKKDFLVEFESFIPFPFPNSVYEMHYSVTHEILLDKPGDEKIYRFELEKSKDLKNLDGFVLIRSLGPKQVLYQELDFLDAHWGIAKALGSGKIWSQSVEEMVNSDFAMKWRAENPQVSGKWVKKMAEQSTEKVKKEIRLCLEKKEEAKYFLDFMIESKNKKEK